MEPYGKSPVIAVSITLECISCQDVRKRGDVLIMRIAIAAIISLFTLSAGLAEDEKPKPKEYPFGEDSIPKDGVPKGKVTKHQIRSEVYPGTIREYFVYVPAQ